MRKLTRDDVLSLDEYLPVRDAMRARVRAARALRRIAVGDRISVSFENRETVLFQIEEMVRVEQIRDEAKLAEEIAVYNDLVGGDGELRATFFVEVTDQARIKDDLDSLVGLETAGLSLLVGDETVPADFEPGHAREDRISAVHYVRFTLTGAQQAALADPAVPVSLAVEHRNYRARAELSPATRATLAEDLGVPTAPGG